MMHDIIIVMHAQQFKAMLVTPVSQFIWKDETPQAEIFEPKWNTQVVENLISTLVFICVCRNMRAVTNRGVNEAQNGESHNWSNHRLSSPEYMNQRWKNTEGWSLHWTFGFSWFSRPIMAFSVTIQKMDKLSMSMKFFEVELKREKVISSFLFVPTTWQQMGASPSSLKPPIWPSLHFSASHHTTTIKSLYNDNNQIIEPSNKIQLIKNKPCIYDRT